MYVYIFAACISVGLVRCPLLYHHESLNSENWIRNLHIWRWKPAGFREHVSHIYIYIYIHTYIHIYKKHDISNHINVLMINFDFKLSFGFLGKPFAGSDRVIKTYPVWMVMRRRYTTWFLGNMILHHRDHFQPTSLVYTSMVQNYNPYYNPILHPSIKIKHGKLPYFITIN